MRIQSLDMTALFVAQGLPPCVREHRFRPPRRWRFDYAWPEQLVAFEYEVADLAHAVELGDVARRFDIGAANGCSR